jgi:hypothetical protein
VTTLSLERRLSALPASRALTVQLNQSTHVATLAAAGSQSEGLLGASQGNAQSTCDGTLFAGWGSPPCLSAFNPGGTLIFNARFPQGVNSHRACLLPFDHAKTAEALLRDPS